MIAPAIAGIYGSFFLLSVGIRYYFLRKASSFNVLDRKSTLLYATSLYANNLVCMNRKRLTSGNYRLDNQILKSNSMYVIVIYK